MSRSCKWTSHIGRMTHSFAYRSTLELQSEDLRVTSHLDRMHTCPAINEATKGSSYWGRSETSRELGCFQGKTFRPVILSLKEKGLQENVNEFDRTFVTKCRSIRMQKGLAQFGEISDIVIPKEESNLDWWKRTSTNNNLSKRWLVLYTVTSCSFSVAEWCQKKIRPKDERITIAEAYDD